MSERETSGTPGPAEVARVLRDPGFCRHSTGRVAVVEWEAGSGWSEPRIEPYGSLSMDPATLGLHYGQAVFEGMKAFRGTDGSVSLFRAADHGRRLGLSAARLAMAEMPVELYVRTCAALVAADERWVPGGYGQSLYLRPLLIATEAEMGLRPSRAYRCVVLAYPSDPCFGRDFRPLAVSAALETVRAVRGGTGESKCAGNYAAGLLTRTQAQAAGYDEALWLDGIERRWVEELSTMNVFFVWDGGDGPRLTTPPCDGTIVRGLTRDSLLTLAGDLGIPAAEEPTALDTVRDGIRSGRLAEVFASGTAGVVVAVGRLGTGAEDLIVGDGTEGPVTGRLRAALLDVQHARTPDTHGWLLPVTGGAGTAAIEGGGRDA
ncbi:MULTISPECIES: branched-chain amino acid aminotransferase [unclassified Streptomyces]|uniref:branched-chain amino acid aminotransferase n=1 Tax=unclassified Streptomyces TaxID=2593676 RepID=UPI001660306B|nr:MULTISPECIES: branched-chain amino acid aminotransferase [unclassified Streptomyces]MBD0709056.1 branched chain amino acid aminotransferase [Streptomyces sp. CBMA291]MBD0715372.1 branched chain amino acid aminotransferase [Streptomyces sp. CBMA370]